MTHVPGSHLEVPEGWQLVPKVPTVEQECAPDFDDCRTPDAAKAIYKAMLAAAPPSPLDIVTVAYIPDERHELLRLLADARQTIALLTPFPVDGADRDLLEAINVVAEKADVMRARISAALDASSKGLGT